MNEKMVKLIFSYSVLALCISGNYARIAPDYMKPCPGLKSDCLKKNIQETLPLFAKGIPELDIATIDPLREGHVAMQLPGNFKVEMNNGSMTGLRKCKIDHVTFIKDEANLKMHCDLTIKGPYKANGRILIVTINGDGNAKIKIHKAIIEAKIKFHDVVRDGVTYYEVKQFDNKFSYGDKVTFSLTNLFKGNPEISEVVLQFLNQNWKQVSEEFGQPLVDRLINLVYGIVKKFFEKVPKDELFID